MRRCVNKFTMLLIIGALLMSAAPVFALAPTAPPVPTPSAQEMAWLSQVLQYARQTSASDASTVNTAVVLIAVFMVIMVLAFLVAVRAISKPAVSVVSNLQERANKAEEERVEQQREHDREVATLNKERAQFAAKTAQSLDQFAASQIRMLDMFESKSDAEKGREDAVEAINRHTSEDGEKTREQLKAVADKVIEAKQTAEKAATVDDLNRVLKPVLDKFDELTETVRDAIRKVDTGPLDAAKVPESDPGLQSSSKQPGS